MVVSNIVIYICLPVLGEMIQFDAYTFQMGAEVQPPATVVHKAVSLFRKETTWTLRFVIDDTTPTVDSE